MREAESKKAEQPKLQAQAILWSSAALRYDGPLCPLGVTWIWSLAVTLRVRALQGLEGQGRFLGDTERRLSLQETLQLVHSAQFSFSQGTLPLSWTNRTKVFASCSSWQGPGKSFQDCCHLPCPRALASISLLGPLGSLYSSSRQLIRDPVESKGRAEVQGLHSCVDPAICICCAGTRRPERAVGSQWAMRDMTQTRDSNLT